MPKKFIFSLGLCVGLYIGMWCERNKKNEADVSEETTMTYDGRILKKVHDGIWIEEDVIVLFRSGHLGAMGAVIRVCKDRKIELVIMDRKSDDEDYKRKEIMFK